MFGVSIVISICRLTCLAFSRTLPFAVCFCERLVGGDTVECCNNVCSSWTFSSFEGFFTKCGVKSAVATASVKPSAHPSVCPCLPDQVISNCPRLFDFHEILSRKSLQKGVKIGTETVILYLRTWMNFRPLLYVFFDRWTIFCTKYLQLMPSGNFDLRGVIRGIFF